MHLLSPLFQSKPGPCPYLKDETEQLEFFFAKEIQPEEIDALLAAGWRKFGKQFFRPACPRCRQCIPLRIPVSEFKPTKSQRKAIVKNKETVMKTRPLQSRPEIYAIYQDHSGHKFSKETTANEFEDSFFDQVCPAFQTEYFCHHLLCAVGFIDSGKQSYSSVYFVYKEAFKKQSLGCYSILREIELARIQGKRFYYLGYFIEKNQSMNYKNRFGPNQKLDWNTGQWR